MSNHIFKTVLDNGLTVLLKEAHHAPVANFFVWYKVGSRHERSGYTGISHWVEHMMFKGTPTFPLGAIDRLIPREGGQFNAFTWLDFTAYYVTMSANRLDIGLQLEADRMVNTIMDVDEVESERTVIISERRMYENHPHFLLGEEVQAAAFRVHPYHHEVIGDEADLRSITRDDLYNHYKQYYAPNNAIAIAVGDFDTQEMLSKITHYFGEIPSSELVELPARPEPPQRGERRVTVEGPGNAAYLTFNYHAPAASHPDYFPLALFNAAFAGGSSLGMFGGGGGNKSSRLYKALVSGELAAGVSASLVPTVDPFLYSMEVLARPDRSLDEIEEALDAELKRFEENPVTEQELQKAMKRAKAQFVMAGESVTGQGQLLGLSSVVTGDTTWYEGALDRLAQVTLEDIERVRQTYLKPSKRVVGRYLPATV